MLSGQAAGIGSQTNISKISRRLDKNLEV